MRGPFKTQATDPEVFGPRELPHASENRFVMRGGNRVISVSIYSLARSLPFYRAVSSNLP